MVMELDFCRSCFKVCIKKFCDVKSVTVEKNTAARYIERRIPIMTPTWKLEPNDMLPPSSLLCTKLCQLGVNYAEAQHQLAPIVVLYVYYYSKSWLLVAHVL